MIHSCEFGERLNFTISALLGPSVLTRLRPAELPVIGPSILWYLIQLFVLKLVNNNVIQSIDTYMFGGPCTWYCLNILVRSALSMYTAKKRLETIFLFQRAYSWILFVFYHIVRRRCRHFLRTSPWICLVDMSLHYIEYMEQTSICVSASRIEALEFLPRDAGHHDASVQ